MITTKSSVKELLKCLDKHLSNAEQYNSPAVVSTMRAVKKGIMNLIAMENEYDHLGLNDEPS